MIGKQIGQFKIVEEIGRGGMGVVYRARQISLDRDVAVKVLPSDRPISPEALARFEREAKVIAQVGHANIVQIIDVGEHEGTRYIVMELVKGRTVSDLLKAKGPMVPRDAAHVAAQVAAALGCIHSKGYVHRDVKPSNIIVDDELNAKVMDFGVALLADQPEGERLTMTRVSVGTPQYMSP
ncbi:MAG: serine/threonine-protein kinase, partial [Verrucomicrobiota bacterium]